ncbi:tyrosine protein phosphatase [Oceanobacillus sp. 143]|uniref:Tyrosine-protein phosphatase n=1 Tax=Oceanobacillus zhaokaii TaxID=2052660 RepID=A0A345PKE3_9BACI|nr:CpsB/CapC family capsule biosynthesis tyrosine phosphatase [Oceanobacillus zhaokaii]AXI10473.1 tyrosine protein phosphatase [Oceanobacillus zhaokaii]QGS69485.1 tyrosine protein phosphatase [Oceanobacillus sp. 143]
MIDIHSHILPGIDDGAQTEEDSLEMAREAAAQGITTIIATPHHRNGKYDNKRGSIMRDVDILNELLVREDIPLIVLPGQETRINGDMVEDINSGELLSLNDSKYLFVEFPSAHVPRYSSQMLFDLQVAGYTPIIVHPERNQELIEHPNKLYEFVRNGALTQVTAASIVGKFGKNIKTFSHQLIEANLTHFVASDAHNTTSRGFSMQEAFREVKSEFGTDYFYMFMENGQLLIDNQNVNRLEPSSIRKKKKKFLGLF